MDDDFRIRQTWAWKYLNYELGFISQRKVQEWCCQEKLEYSVASRLAHLMLTSRDEFDSSSAAKEKYNLMHDHRRGKPLPSCSSLEDWTELCQWKHPELGLNLLQLATVCRHPSGVKYLWQDCFTREDLYRDASSRLVNCPWHLVLALKTGLEEELTFLEKDVDLLLKEGRVDMREDLLHKWTATKTLLESRADVALTGTGTGLSWAGAEGLRWFESRLIEVLLKPCTPTFVECFWELAWNNPRFPGKCNEPLILKIWGKVLYEIGESSYHAVGRWTTLLAEECLILLSQSRDLTNTYYDPMEQDRQEKVSEKMKNWQVLVEKSSLDSFVTLFWHALDLGIPMKKAAGYLPPSLLSQVVEDIKKYPHTPRDPHYRTNRKELKDMAHNVKSLKNLCVLPVLEIFKGDARKIWSLWELPLEVKELFHVPFQALRSPVLQ